MKYQDLIKEVRNLSLKEQVRLIELTSRFVQDELSKGEKTLSNSSIEKLRGIAKPDGPMPSDEELKEDYINYLVEKYS